MFGSCFWFGWGHGDVHEAWDGRFGNCRGCQNVVGFGEDAVVDLHVVGGDSNENFV